MNDYVQMRRHLESLSKVDLAKLLDKMGRDICLNGDEAMETGPEHSMHLLEWDWAEKTIEELLQCREKDISKWAHLCYVVGIEMDEIREIAMSRAANTRANIALLISAISALGIVANIIITLWKTGPK
jgi:hypothetical protein